MRPRGLGRRRVGMLLTAVGALMLISGLAGLASTNGDENDAARAPTAAQRPAATAPPVPATGADVSAPSAATMAAIATPSVSTSFPAATSEPPPATTETPPPSPAPRPAAATTTTTPPQERIAAFIDFFSAAISRGDVDALMASLHPAVVDAYGEELCRSFTQTEILALEDYTLTGAVTGPVSKSLDGGGDPVLVTDIYEAAVRFTFQGQSFDTSSDFVVTDTVSWLAICR